MVAELGGGGGERASSPQAPTHQRERGSGTRRAGARIARRPAEVRPRRASAPVTALEPGVAADEAARRRRVAVAVDRVGAAHRADASAALRRSAATGSTDRRARSDGGGRRRDGRGDGGRRLGGAGAGDDEEREEPSKRGVHVELQGGPGQRAAGPGAYMRGASPSVISRRALVMSSSLAPLLDEAALSRPLELSVSFRQKPSGQRGRRLRGQRAVA